MSGFTTEHTLRVFSFKQYEFLWLSACPVISTLFLSSRPRHVLQLFIVVWYNHIVSASYSSLMFTAGVSCC